MSINRQTWAILWRSDSLMNKILTKAVSAAAKQTTTTTATDSLPWNVQHSVKYRSICYIINKLQVPYETRQENAGYWATYTTPHWRNHAVPADTLAVQISTTQHKNLINRQITLFLKITLAQLAGQAGTTLLYCWQQHSHLICAMQRHSAVDAWTDKLTSLARFTSEVVEWLGYGIKGQSLFAANA